MAFEQIDGAMERALTRVRKDEATRGSKHNADTFLTPMVRAEIIGHLRTNVLPDHSKLEDLFTLMALVYGPPSWGRTIAWVNMLEQALDIPRNTFTITEGDEWLRTYQQWYEAQR